jgi:nucleoid DNA-binding protein
VEDNSAEREDGRSTVRTKSEVLRRVAEEAGVEKKRTAATWDLLLHLAIDETKTRGQFLLPGIGTISLEHRKGRTGRNPQTGQSMNIPPKTMLRFRFVKTFKDAVLPPKPPTATPKEQHGNRAA